MKRALNLLAVAVGVAITAAMFTYGISRASDAEKMVGVVASPGTMALEVSDQVGTRGKVMVDMVKVPDRSWIVVYLAGMGGMPGTFIGAKNIPQGESRDVAVLVGEDIELTEKVLVTVQADRGIRGRFEFDGDRFEASPDKPYYIGQKEFSRWIAVRFSTSGNTF